MAVAAAATRVGIQRVLRESDRHRKAAQLQYLAQQFRVTVLNYCTRKSPR